MSFFHKVKIQLSDINFGPTDPELDDIVVFTVAGELHNLGYRKISNSYCRIARIDRNDWVEVLAQSRRCSVADFYNVDGSGIGSSHRDYYIRCFSEDVLTVHPQILRKLSSFE